jgi:DinB superfamily
MQFKIEQAIELLAQTPATLRAMLGNLSEDWTGGGTPENWAPFDIVGHLIHGESTDWIPRARIILAQGENVTFTPYDRFAQFEYSKGKTLHELLDEFEALRGENIAELRSMDITPDKLALKGMHPELGEVDLEKLLSTWVVHDLNHVRQIVKFMAGKYEKAVGPWKEYLSILK